MSVITQAKPAEIIDRTMTLDAAELWPDALNCPDWPMLSGTMRYDGPRGREGAEARLERIGRVLNLGERRLKAPTDAEREQVFAKTFGRSGAKWNALGLNNLSPKDRLAEQDADLIVEAAHLRGYLRKLDVQELREAEEKEYRVRAQAQHRLDGYAPAVERDIAELESLREAVKRHEQRLADERAVLRSHDLRHTLRATHSEAVAAAGVLGVEPPAAPQFE